VETSYRPGLDWCTRQQIYDIELNDFIVVDIDVWFAHDWKKVHNSGVQYRRVSNLRLKFGENQDNDHSATVWRWRKTTLCGNRKTIAGHAQWTWHIEMSRWSWRWPSQFIEAKLEHRSNET